MNNRLDLLLRKNRGKHKKEACEAVYRKSGLITSTLKLIELEEFDKVSFLLRSKFDIKNVFYELTDGESFEDSALLIEIKNKYSQSMCYVYSYDCQECGIYLMDVDTAIKCILELAKYDYQNTCYMIDKNLEYSFTINYNDEDNNSDPCTFDIQLWKISPLG